MASHPVRTHLQHCTPLPSQVISPETLVGYMEQPKASNITKVFEDAYKSPLSIVILVSSDCRCHSMLVHWIYAVYLLVHGHNHSHVQPTQITSYVCWM